MRTEQHASPGTGLFGQSRNTGVCPSVDTLAEPKIVGGIVQRTYATERPLCIKGGKGVASILIHVSDALGWALCKAA
jgi:hypothetical protein